MTISSMTKVSLFGAVLCSQSVVRALHLRRAGPEHTNESGEICLKLQPGEVEGGDFRKALENKGITMYGSDMKTFQHYVKSVDDGNTTGIKEGMHLAEFRCLHTEYDMASQSRWIAGEHILALEAVNQMNLVEGITLVFGTFEASLPKLKCRTPNVIDNRFGTCYFIAVFGVIADKIIKDPTWVDNWNKLIELPEDPKGSLTGFSLLWKMQKLVKLANKIEKGICALDPDQMELLISYQQEVELLGDQQKIASQYVTENYCVVVERLRSGTPTFDDVMHVQTLVYGGSNVEMIRYLFKDYTDEFATRHDLPPMGLGYGCSSPEFYFHASAACPVDYEKLATIVKVPGHVMSLTKSERNCDNVCNWRNYERPESVRLASGLQDCWKRGTKSGLAKCHPNMAEEYPDFEISRALWKTNFFTTVDVPAVAQDKVTNPRVQTFKGKEFYPAGIAFTKHFYWSEEPADNVYGAPARVILFENTTKEIPREDDMDEEVFKFLKALKRVVGRQLLKIGTTEVEKKSDTDEVNILKTLGEAEKPVLEFSRERVLWTT